MSSLPDIRLDGVTYGVARLTHPWALSIPPTHSSYLCLVRKGEAWFEPSIGSPERVHVTEGAVITIPRGQAHVWKSAPDVPRPTDTQFYPLVLPGEAPAGSAHNVELFVGIAPLDAGPPITHLTDALPPFLHIPSTEHAMLAHLNALIGLIEFETLNRDHLIDSQAVLRRLSEVVAIDCARFALTRTDRAMPSWIAGMTDPCITQALSLLHARPEFDWNVGSLAKHLGVSRSAFAQRFKTLVGEGPMHYLVRIRMQHAAAEIRGGRSSLHEIALALGYQSEAAFSRAFSQHMGTSPGRFRSAG
ncbi:MAG: AraC family transcriptional regulator [Gammaproteobacteria bacterium]